MAEKKKTSYYTFGVDHPYAKSVQKIIAKDPRAVMFDIFGSNWAWEYFPGDVTENDDGTVTIHGRRRDYTYKMLPTVER